MAAEGVAARVARKELLLFFSSPVAWLFLASFAAVTLFIFFWVEAFFARNISDIRPLFEWMPVLLIFLAGALTMRMWSEERRSGTIEFALTQPVRAWQLVLGKFGACLALLLLALVATLPLPVTVSLLADLDWGPVLAAYLAAVLLGATYLSVGLYLSARTDNAIVSLIATVAVCGLLYLAGSATLTGFFGNRTGELLRLLGTGSRFESITRGVIDARDLAYYLSLTAAFLVLNVHALERQRWSGGSASPRRRSWRLALWLVLANLLLANVWLARIDSLRADLTEGHLYSISPVTHRFLARLQEPLLIRGYFSTRTHPLLAPLVPELRDLLREYEAAGGGVVRVEIVDPAQDPELEREANERYGIRPTPFQVADRYQASLVNSYFNVLVRYGDEQETLGFSDLIEVRAAPNAQAEVMLRNPEYDVTRAIKDVMYNYHMGGSLFDAIDRPVELIAYVSADERLPEQLRAYRASIAEQLENVVSRSGGKFSVRFIEPEARDGAVASRIARDWGLRPMTSALDRSREFYFYLTLADGNQVVQLPTGDFDPGGFRSALDAGLKRFARGFTRTVALALPGVEPAPARPRPGVPGFDNLESAIARDYSIRHEDLADGSVAPDADILAVVAPYRLDDSAVLAIDQFLMRGGTVVLATSPYTVEMGGGELVARDWPSGLRRWLAHNGLVIGRSLVRDEQNSPLPAPATRRGGEYEFRDLQMVDYPWFVDLRAAGLAGDHPVTRNVPQLTMAWASPISVEPRPEISVTPLLTSSPRSRLGGAGDVMPVVGATGRTSGSGKPAADGQQLLGVVLQGRFESFFAAEPGAPAGVSALVRRAPESARIVLYSSNDFLDDQVLQSLVSASGTQYLGAIDLFLNTLDWAMQDEDLLGVRSRAHFNRTLPPMERRAQAIIEYLNYGLAVSWLLVLAAVHRLRRIARRRRYARELAL